MRTEKQANQPFEGAKAAVKLLEKVTHETKEVREAASTPSKGIHAEQVKSSSKGQGTRGL